MNNSLWREYKKKVAALSLRERALITLVGVVLFVCPCYFTFYDTNMKKCQEYQQTIDEKQLELDSVKGDIDIWQARLSRNPNDVMREDIAKYKSRLSELDKKIDAATINLIDAAQMATALASILHTEPGVTVLAMDSLAPKQLLKKGDACLYQHGIRLRLKGRYMDILRHLQALEGMKQNFYWHSLNYMVTDYPYGEVEIELYTLSINKDFIRG